MIWSTASVKLLVKSRGLPLCGFSNFSSHRAMSLLPQNGGGWVNVGRPQDDLVVDLVITNVLSVALSLIPPPIGNIYTIISPE